MKKNLTITLVFGFILGLVAVGAFWLLQSPKPLPEEIVEPEIPAEEPVLEVQETVLGYSVEGRPIEVFRFGNGENHVLFVGGIHGGYEWNSVYLAYRMIDYLTASPQSIPADVTVSIIPSANPDGLFDVVGSGGRFALDAAPDSNDGSGLGRFNANEVDLNRNFDCKWSPTSVWKGNPVSPGTVPFSEPESIAIRDYVLESELEAVVFWHSQGNAVYGSECVAGVLPETLAVMNAYANAAGYEAIPAFTAYPVTGDAEGWLASIGIPALTVELSSHEAADWEKNLAGTLSLLEFLSSQEESLASPQEETDPNLLVENEPVEDDLPIELEVCHTPFEIGTYETVTLGNAVSLAFPILKARNSEFEAKHLSVQDTNEDIRIEVSREFFVLNGEDNYCNTWEENNSCIGQWIDFEDGKIMMEAQNPC